MRYPTGAGTQKYAVSCSGAIATGSSILRAAALACDFNHCTASMTSAPITATQPPAHCKLRRLLQ